MAVWGVWEEQIGAWAGRAGPTLASCPATPTFGIRGGSRRRDGTGAGGETEGKGDGIGAGGEMEGGQKVLKDGERDLCKIRNRSHGKQKRMQDDPLKAGTSGPEASPVLSAAKGGHRVLGNPARHGAGPGLY